MNISRSGIAGTLLLSLAIAGCDSSGSGTGDTFEVTYEPPFTPAEMGPDVTNSYFPLPVGATWMYEGDTEDGREVVQVEVLAETRTVAGVEVRVVRDQVFLDGNLIEDTFDWYAQDADGNVWYMGEQTKEMENGQVVSTEGSWEAGVNGAVAGIVMPAHPAVNQAYKQEFLAGEAEDRARVLSINESVQVPAGTFPDCIKTEDTTPLERDVLEYKYYCRGVGTALEVDVEEDAQFPLIEFDLL